MTAGVSAARRHYPGPLRLAAPPADARSQGLPTLRAARLGKPNV